jgi:hypothetical protein
MVRFQRIRQYSERTEIENKRVQKQRYQQKRKQICKQKAAILTSKAVSSCVLFNKLTNLLLSSKLNAELASLYRGRPGVSKPASVYMRLLAKFTCCMEPLP